MVAIVFSGTARKTFASLRFNSQILERQLKISAQSSELSDVYPQTLTTYAHKGT